MFHQEFGSVAILRNYPAGRNPLDISGLNLTALWNDGGWVWLLSGFFAGVLVYWFGLRCSRLTARAFELTAVQTAGSIGSLRGGLLWGGMMVVLVSGLIVTRSSYIEILVILGVSGVLGVLAQVDWHTGYLPDALTQPLLWAGLCWSWLGYGVPVGQALGGAMGVYVFLVMLFGLYRWARHHEGMGYGDIKLAAALGAWVGASFIIELLLLACLFGIVLAVFRGGFRGFAIAFPFGPCLALSGVLFLVLLAP